MLYEAFTHLLCVSWLQLDQLVIDSAMEKRVMEHQHAVIQQRVSTTRLYFHFSRCLSEIYSVLH